MADILQFPATAETTVRLEAADLLSRSRQSRVNRLRAIDKATIHHAVAEGVPLTAAMAFADRHLAAIKARLEQLEQARAYDASAEPIAAIGGAA